MIALTTMTSTRPIANTSATGDSSTNSPVPMTSGDTTSTSEAIVSMAVAARGR